jgi:hypothetical protein
VKNGQCPKCNSTQVYSGADVFPKSGPFTCNAIPISLTALAPLDNYVCTDCGYVESYISTSEDLATVRRKWPLAAEVPVTTEAPATAGD